MITFFKKNILYSVLILLGLICFWGSLIYWMYALDMFGVVLNLVLALGSFIIILRALHRNQKDANPRSINNAAKGFWVLTAVYLLFWGWGLYLLFSAGTRESIISPWTSIPDLFFLSFFLASLVLFVLILKNKGKAKILLHFHAFLMFSVAAIVYKIGYGFDPFIHEATLKLIDETGAVTPKPLYYIGQYSLIITLHNITFLPLIFLNKFLVPILAALFLPEVLDRALRPRLGKRNSLLIIFFLPVLSFAPFIVTVPQNLSYIFLISVIALGVNAASRKDLAVISLLAVTTFFVHPISGIPAILFTIGLIIFKTKRERILYLPKRIYYIGIFLVSSISLPLAFFLGAQADLRVQGLKNIFPDMNMFVPGREDLVLNFVYLFGNFKGVGIAVIALAGVYLTYRHRDKFHRYHIYLNIGLALVVSYFLCRAFLDFSSLIDYEQNNYSQRILILALFFFLPFIAAAFHGIIKRTLAREKSIKIPILVFGSLLLPASLYLSYPRIDNYHNSHFHSVGSTDLEAVEWIEENSGGDYIVLANQQVSVAALRKIGFDRYYKEDIYFYPIPTGGQLYQYYLDMVYEKPTQETMAKAMEFAGVDKGYFVLNEYWWAFDKIKQEAKLEADSWESIDREEVLIFEYNK